MLAYPSFIGTYNPVVGSIVYPGGVFCTRISSKLVGAYGTVVDMSGLPVNPT